MKKINAILFSALALIAAASCNKEVELQDNPANGKAVVLTAKLEGTKTSLDGVNIVWSRNDYISAFNIGGDNIMSTQTEVNDDGSEAQFTVEPGADLMYAIYPYNDAATMDDNGTITTEIPTTQQAVAGSFADGANLAIANIVDVNDIRFKNVGGLLAFKVKSTEHNIVSATISGTEASGAGMTGAVAVSINSSDQVTTVCSGEGSVTVSGTIEVGETYYAVVAPGTYSNVKIVFTDSEGKTATYTKNSDLVVERNSNQLIGGFSPDSRWQEKYYVKVTSDDDIVAGYYLIVHETLNDDLEDVAEVFSGVNNNLGTVASDIPIIQENGVNKIAQSVGGAYNVVVEELNNGYSIGWSTGYLAYNKPAGTTSNNYLYLSGAATDTGAEWILSVEGIQNAYNTERYLQFNLNKGGDPRFACYKNTQENVSLYLLEGSGQPSGKQSVSLSFNPTSVELTYGDDFTEPELTSTPAGLSVTYSSSDEDVATVDETTGEVTIVAAGTATITATFPGNDDYKRGSASYTITVSSGVRTLASITKAENGVVVKDVMAMAISGSNVVIKDASGLFLLFKSGHGLKVGDLFDLEGDVTLFGTNNILEFSANITISNKRTATVDHGTAVEFDSVAEGLETNTKVTYVHAKGDQGGKNITTADENVLRLSEDNTSTDGLKVEIYGYTIGYSSQYSNHSVIATDIHVDPDVAVLSVDENELTWLCNETGSKTVNVTVNANGGFTYSTTDMDWATVAVENNVITVTPKDQNSNATPNTGTIVLTHSVDNTKTVEISCEQGAFINLIETTVTFTPAVNGGMTTTAGTQTGVRRNVTAVISNGIVYPDYISIYKSSTLTLSVPSGAKITQIEFSCTSDNPISGFADVTGLVKNGNNGVWTGSAESVTFTASNKQVRATAINVTYSIEESQLAKYAPTINASDKAIYIGDSDNIGATSDSEGTISYSIVSGSEYITLNTSTGAITGVAEGTAVVKVSVAANGDYDAGSKNVNVTVSKRPEVVSQVTFDFSSITETVTGGWNGDHTVSPITINASNANTNKAGQVRFQNGGTVTFTGATITRIEIINSGNYPGNFSADVGTYTVDGNNGIWTGSATQIVLTNNGNGTRTTSIVVTYN